MVRKKTWGEKNLGRKYFVPNQFLVKNNLVPNLWSQKDFGQNGFIQKKKFGQKEVITIFFSKKMNLSKWTLPPPKKIKKKQAGAELCEAKHSLS